jgi:hypothetical protein
MIIGTQPGGIAKRTGVRRAKTRQQLAAGARDSGKGDDNRNKLLTFRVEL